MADTADVAKKLARESTFQNLVAAEQARNTSLENLLRAIETKSTDIPAWVTAALGLPTVQKTALKSALYEVLGLNNSVQKSIEALPDIYAILDDNADAGNGAGLHNSIYRGKNLGSSPTADQYARIVDRTYKGLWLADCWSKSVSFSYLVPPIDVHGNAGQGDDTPIGATITPVMRIADHDYYRHAGDNIDLKTGHLDIIPDANLYTAPINKQDANGATFTTGAYAGSEMRTKYLAAAVSIFESFFGANHVLSYRDYLQNAVTNGRPSGGSWYDCKVELMDERQVYGGLVFDSGSTDGIIYHSSRYTVATKQFALFSVAPLLISNRRHFWLRNVVSTTTFAYVKSDGMSADINSCYVSGVRPAALIC